MTWKSEEHGKSENDIQIELTDSLHKNLSKLIAKANYETTWAMDNFSKGLVTAARPSVITGLAFYLSSNTC